MAAAAADLESRFVQGNLTLQNSKLTPGPRADAPTNPVRKMTGASGSVLNFMLGYDSQNSKRRRADLQPVRRAPLRRGPQQRAGRLRATVPLARRDRLLVSVEQAHVQGQGAEPARSVHQNQARGADHLRGKPGHELRSRRAVESLIRRRQRVGTRRARFAPAAVRLALQPRLSAAASYLPGRSANPSDSR